MATFGSYDQYQRVRISGAFTVSDVATDPTAVTFKIKDPSSNITTYVYGTDAEVVKASTGNYYVDYDVDEVGVWYFKWRGTGAVVAANESEFYVQETEF